MVHAAKSGVAHFYYKNEYECIEAVRFWLIYYANIL